MPDGLAHLDLCLRGFAIRRSEFCLSASRNKIGDVSRVRMHLDLVTGLAAEFEHAHAVVLQQHLEVIWSYLDRILRTGLRCGQTQGRSEAHNYQHDSAKVFHGLSPCFAYGGARELCRYFLFSAEVSTGNHSAEHCRDRWERVVGRRRKRGAPFHEQI